ncbi:MAG: hypothetical protein J6K77_03425 [Ruminococcus sp.]|nr:hypothetical protein [Ruminococcus sp.]
MADAGKKAKVMETFYFIFMTLLVLGFGFFAYCKLTDSSLRLFGRLFGCYSLGFFAVLLFFIVRSVMVFVRTGKKMNYRLFLDISAVVITLFCLINSLATDMKASAAKDILRLGDKSSVMLCESVLTDDNDAVTEVRIDVYAMNGRLCRKIGEIDETLFSVRCVETDSYRYYISEDGRQLTLECLYGTYGSGTYTLTPQADTGTLTYVFEIK